MFGFPSRNKVSPELTRSVGAWFNEHELKTIDRLGTVVQLAEGAILTTEGRPGRETMLMISGSADVRRGDISVATVTAGDIIGEQAVLTGLPRNATLVASTSVRVVVFTSREFRSLLDVCPRLDVAVNELQSRRLVSA